MARRRKRRITAGARSVNASLVSIIGEEDDACGGGKTKRTPAARPSDGLCFSQIGGGNEEEVAIPTGGAHRSVYETEASRRNKMKDLYSVLHTFLPHLPPKTDRAKLAEETANYIKVLEHMCQGLEKRKQDRTKSPDPYERPPSGAATPALSPELSMSREAALADQTSKIPFQTGVMKPAHQQCFTMQTSASPNVVLSVAGPDAHVSVCAPKTPGLISTTVHFLEKHGAEVLSVQVCSDMSRTMFAMHAHMSGFDDSMLAKESFELAKEELILWLGSPES